jgi:glycosyltransferase involved in cell wall biosynthesis
VLATNVNGAAEVVRSRAAGCLAPERSAEGLARGLEDLLQDPPSREETRRYAEGFGWRQTAEANLALLNAAARQGYAPSRDADRTQEGRARFATAKT